MNYCTKQDLIDRIGGTELIQLTDRDNAGQVDEEVLAEVGKDADGKIDSYLRTAGIAVPLNNPPRVIVRCSADIQRKYLWKDAASDEVNDNHDEAIAFLKDVAAGRAVLDLGVDGTADGNGGAAPVGRTAIAPGQSNIDWSSY